MSNLWNWTRCTFAILISLKLNWERTAKQESIPLASFCFSKNSHRVVHLCKFSKGLSTTKQPYLVTTDNQQWRICRMEDAWMEFISITAQLMNTFPFTSWSQRPNSDRILTNRCKELTRRTPADRVDWLSMPLHPKDKSMGKDFWE